MKKEKKNIIHIVFKVLFFSILAVCLFIAAEIMFKANAYPDKVPDVFGYKPMIVLSGSMESSIEKGDLVFVKIVDTNILKVNDIIAYRNEENTVTTHRIVEIVEQDGDKYFRTKGDNNNVEDYRLVSLEDVEGIYVSKVAGLGNVLLFLKKPVGLIIILLVILVGGLSWLYFLNTRDQRALALETEKYKRELEKLQKKQEQKKTTKKKNI